MLLHVRHDARVTPLRIHDLPHPLQNTEQKRRAAHRCVRCGDRSAEPNQTACKVCLEEARTLYLLRQEESRRARAAAEARLRARAGRKPRTVTINGREFIVAWDGTQ